MIGKQISSNALSDLREARLVKFSQKNSEHACNSTYQNEGDF